jgi:NADH-quinone oxidoreductase subunit N
MLENFTALLPEVFLAGVTLFALVVGVFSKPENQFKNAQVISITGLISVLALFYVSAGSQGLNPTVPTSAEIFANGMFFSYNFTVIMKILITICAIVLLLLARPFLETKQHLKFEYNILFLTAVLGAFVAVSTLNLVVMFIGLELLSFSLYVLVGFVRDSKITVKSANKYFIVGSVASSLMLYGISLVYVTTGGVSYESLALFIEKVGVFNLPFEMFLALSLILMALLFKIAIVPLHFYISDVLVGSNRPVLGFISTVSKIVGLMVLFQILVIILPVHAAPVDYYTLMLTLAIISVFVGSAYALRENNINRFLAYSSINNAGFMLITVMVTDFGSLLFYLVNYCLVTLALVSFLLSFKVRGEYIKTIQDLAFITKKNHKFALLGVFLIFALSGVPPFVMFYAKLLVIQNLVAMGFITAAVLLVIGSVISVAYCLRLIKYIYLADKDADVSIQKIPFAKLITYLLFILILVFSILPDTVLYIF